VEALTTNDINDRLDRQQERIAEQTETLRAQRERIAELEARLDRIESELGVEATADQQGVADD
jgi:predicted  nucleic acid-binding Zn-ribbon protein